jgi:hypothetical protein
MTRKLRPLAALAMLALIVAGCGNGTAGTGDSSATGAGDGTAAVQAKAVKFAECMRSNGVSEFPDPNGSGAYTIDGVVNGSSLDPNSAAFKQAIDACKNLEPPGFTGARATPQQRTARLEFARCMRDNGVRDFPDPTPSGPLVDTYRIPSSSTAGGMSILNAAMHKCTAVYAGELGLKGK